ncbi:UPF0149 family protein [Methylobacter svalbardensis]|uniref:UPF0149 family protein n=1 Tax=Methylobacter svalbardensis TaxID=3080016 RepID=UPI0030EF09DA
MLSEKTQSNITQLLKIIGPEKCLNVTEIQGLLYAVVITPDPIEPDEWLPIIFDDEIHEYGAVEAMQQLRAELLTSCAHYSALDLKARLHFPYAPKKMTLELFDTMKDWTWGFFLGMEMRSEFWTNLRAARKEGLNLEDDPVENCFKIIEFLVDDDFDDEEFVTKINQGVPPGLSEEDVEMYVEYSCLELLPTAVKNIQRLSCEVKKRTAQGQTIRQMPEQSIQLRRNDLCHCGSGKKYKKCCLH